LLLLFFSPVLWRLAGEPLMHVYYDDYWAAGWMGKHFGARFGGELQPSDGMPSVVRHQAVSQLRDITYFLRDDCFPLFESAPPLLPRT
jgi:hypothetical protein